MEPEEQQPLLEDESTHRSYNGTESSPTEHRRICNKISSSIKNIKNSISVEVPAFLYFFAFSIQDTLVIDLLLKRTCYIHFNLSMSVCANMSSLEEQNDVQIYVDYLLLIKNLVENVPAVLFILCLGSFCDKYGRKLPMTFPFMANFVSSIILVIIAYMLYAPPEYLLLMSIPRALSGGVSVFLMASYSYISDTSSESARVIRIAFLDATIMFGPLFGSLLSGPLYNAIDYVGCFSVSCTLFFVGAFYIWVCITESRSRESIENIDGRPDEEGNLVWRCMKDMYLSLKTAVKSRDGYDRMVILMSIFGLGLLCFSLGLLNVRYLFVEKKFNWNYSSYTYLSAAGTLSVVFGCVFGLSVLTKIFHISDMGLNLLGSLSGIAGHAFTAFAFYDWFLYIAAAVSTLSALPFVVCRAVVSKVTPAGEIGKIFSVIACVESLSPLASVPIITFLYNATIATFPGAVFFLGVGVYAVIFLGTGILMYFLRREATVNVDLIT